MLRGLLLLRGMLRGILRGTSKPCIYYLFVSNAKEAREMNDKGANMKHDELMALADAYANSYMTFHEKAARIALFGALAKVVQDAERYLDADAAIDATMKEPT
jgi:hypothetical protein